MRYSRRYCGCARRSGSTTCWPPRSAMRPSCCSPRKSCRACRDPANLHGANSAPGAQRMHVFNLKAEQKFDPKKHVERVLGRVAEGDVTVACWEPGQTSPYHCHPHATEIYFCFEGGGTMKTPAKTIEVVSGSFVVHPPGELHEWITGPERTLLFR